MSRRATQEPNKIQTLPSSRSLLRQLPLHFQQRILDIFKSALASTSLLPNLNSTIQEIKDALYHRDFARAFSNSNADYLDAYVLRWSSTRALAYAQIFNTPDLRLFSRRDHDSKRPEIDTTALSPFKVVCIGAGAGAELLATASAVRPGSNDQISHIDLTLVDIADWSGALAKLRHALISSPEDVQLTIQLASPAHGPFVKADSLEFRFVHEDVLTWRSEVGALFTGAHLVTIMFTLNELFTTSLSKTTTVLLGLTEIMSPGSCLLVVDSPGSYAEVSLGKIGQVKKYPMKWLLDHTLLNVAGVGKWKKEVDEESIWYRLDDRLKYPIKLENTRYQMHIYRRDSDLVSEGNRDGDTLTNLPPIS